MIPTINVTSHSPATVTKFNNIFDDTLIQLQNIRESVVQMKNSNAQTLDSPSFTKPENAAVLNASLPDLSIINSYKTGGTLFLRWVPQKQQYIYMNERRKSWNTMDDINVANKSVSLSSFESEPETIFVPDQRRRSVRNSSGGISTHSLNEAELTRDFQRIAAKRTHIAESRIPLQKSVSTSSIVVKEVHHLYDSEDDSHCLIRAHDKIGSFNIVEKRRKRGSLFFRKKKDKVKIKSIDQTNNCESCGVNVISGSSKEHQLECKGKSKISVIGQKVQPSNTKKEVDKSEAVQDYYNINDLEGNFCDDSLLIRSEFCNDPPIAAHDLGADPILGITEEEHDSWSPSVPKDILKSLKEKQIKRQEHIYEFIMTEKHHCQTLLVMQKVFIESIERYFPSLNVNNMFPRLTELIELHIGFLRKLRQKQREQYVVDSIADILLDFFSMEKAQHLRIAYGEFCANHRSALQHFKLCMSNHEQSFPEWYKHCLANPLLKKKGIPECILFVTQRLTKYPLLIEPLLKNGYEDKLESEKLQHALNLVKALLVDVDSCVAEKELRERQINIYLRVDPKSFAIFKNKPFRKLDIGIESRRRLKFEGIATLMQGRSKMQLVLVVVLTDCLCFLSENSGHNKYTFFTPEHKAGVVPLQKLLIREKAGTEARGIYIISSNPSFPEMYELKVQQPKDKNVWIQSIRQAVLECPSSDVTEMEDITTEEKLRIGVGKRDLIDKIRQKDIDHAILLEDKIYLQLNLLKENKNYSEATTATASTNSSNALSFLSSFGSYKDLVGVECDTAELWKYVINMVQSISHLASMVYSASTGLPVSRSMSSVGEKHSDTFSSYILPKRAETFAGFDEKRNKNSHSRDSPKILPMNALTPRLQELEEKRETKESSLITLMLQSTSGNEQMYNELPFEDITIKDHNFFALQISHHLHTLLCIISQQMTTIHNLQLQLAIYRETPRAPFTHDNQLEELRNLQDKLQEDKMSWIRQKEQQEEELDEKRAQLCKLIDKIKTEQEDIKQQREQLYRKMEILSNQGLLLSPNTPFMINNPFGTTICKDDTHNYDDSNLTTMSTESSASIISTATQVVADRGKNKWRTSSTISKTPPQNLLSATNAPKVSQACIKQKIPMKLSSHTSFSNTPNIRIDKSPSFNISQQSICGQLLPMKLADKHFSTSSFNVQPALILPQHERTGSSPAIIQHPGRNNLSSPTLATDFPPNISSPTLTIEQRQPVIPDLSRTSYTPVKAKKTVLPVTNATFASLTTNQTRKPEEEEIYF